MTVIEPESLNAVNVNGDWEMVTFAVDSGASETVIKPETLGHMRAREGEACRKGVKYDVANGEIIENQGEKSFIGETRERVKRSVTAQVCDVNRDLLSVSKVVNNGSRVVFDPSGSYIEDVETKEKVWLKESGGMYTLNMWVRRSPF